MMIEPGQANRIEAIVAKSVAKHNARQMVTPSWNVGGTVLQPLWTFLENCEATLIAFMAQKQIDADGHTLEWGLLLYILNNPTRFGLRADVATGLRWLGMPASSITDALFQEWVTILETSGVVTGDGSIIATTKWNALDPNWTLTLVYYIYYRYIDHGAVANFGTNPLIGPVTSAGDELVLGLISDWGTGEWSDGSTSGPSSAVYSSLRTYTPDVVVHLGDTYYAGLDPEVSSNLVNAIQGLAKQMFTLNANHEMYDGANGYFGTALATGGPFGLQQGTSYFALTYGKSVIIGLDTAFYDQSMLYLDGALTDEKQIAFLRKLDLTDKTVIVLTHHNPITFDGTSKMKLYGQVVSALGKAPAYWYWGHQHDGIVYSDRSACGPVKGRCVGHGALPFGNAYSLAPEGGGYIPSVTYYANTPYPQPDVDQKNRVLNGFALLRISMDGTLTETFYDQNGNQAWTSPVHTDSGSTEPAV